MFLGSELQCLWLQEKILREFFKFINYIKETIHLEYQSELKMLILPNKTELNLHPLRCSTPKK